MGPLGYTIDNEELSRGFKQIKALFRAGRQRKPRQLKFKDNELDIKIDKLRNELYDLRGEILPKLKDLHAKAEDFY